MVDANELAKESEDVKENVKRKFLVTMPDDFYQFWEFCKSQNPSDPRGVSQQNLCALMSCMKPWSMTIVALVATGQEQQNIEVFFSLVLSYRISFGQLHR